MDIRERLSRVESHIDIYPDFPKPGILFRDIFPITRNPEVLADLINLMVEHIQQLQVDIQVIVGLEARGFIFGPMIAERLKIPFVPIRKKGKLPGKCIQATYELEYGKDVFEVQAHVLSAGQNVIVVDDLLATGGTLTASVQLLTSLNVKVVECMVVVEMADLKGRDKVPAKLHAFISQSDMK